MTAESIKARRNWVGTAEKLVAEVASVLGATVPDDEVRRNIRMLRYYQTVGAVSRPERRGKQAIYGYRHLLEVLVVSTLVKGGWPLSKVTGMTNGASDDELEAMVPPAAPPEEGPPKPGSRAQALVQRFAAQSPALRETAMRYAASSRSDAVPAGAPGRSPSAPSVATDWRSTVELRLPFSARLIIEAKQLERLTPDDIHELAEAIEHGLRTAQRQQPKRPQK